jgi:hypothetical protein
MSQKARHHEFNSSETHEVFNYSGPVTTNGPPSEYNANQLRYEEDTWPRSDGSSIAAFYTPSHDDMKKLDLDLEKLGNHEYTAPLWARSSHSIDEIFTEDPRGKEAHPPPTLPVSAEVPKPSIVSRLHTIAFIIITCSAQFLSLCGMNQTVAPVMILAEYFGIADYGTLSWFSAAYSLTVGTFILPAGETLSHRLQLSMGYISQ